MANPEIWRLVPSVPGVLASNRGRIMIIPTRGPSPFGGVRHYSARARRGCWDATNKRYVVHIREKTYRVSRLVCEAFHGPPPSPETVCMHQDENSKNNDQTNLRWGTQKENLNAPGFIDYCRSRTGENSPRIKGQRRAA